jgi:hypothetical protein
VQNEPNNTGNEDYLQISQAIQPDGTTGAWNDLKNQKNATDLIYQPRGYVRETDQGNLLVNDDVEGGGFEIGNALFQKFIFSSMISLDTVENSKKALSSLESALDGVSDARAIGAASLSRLEKEIE